MALWWPWTPRATVVAARVDGTPPALDVRFAIATSRPTSARHARVTLRCVERWCASTDMGEIWTELERARIRVVAPVKPTNRPETRSGEHASMVDCRLPLPSGLPASYRGERVQLAWEVSIRLLPRFGWVRSQTFRLPLTPPAPPALHGAIAPDSPALVFATDAGGPSGAAPYAEVALSSTTWTPGGRVTLALSASDLARTDTPTIVARLIARESLEGRLDGFSHDRVAASWSVTAPASATRDGLRFALDLPGELDPAVAGRRICAAWFLDVLVGPPARTLPPRREARLWIPIVVLPPTPGATPPTPSPLPAVGLDRASAIWARAAAQLGMRVRADFDLERSVGLWHARLEECRDARGRVQVIASLSAQAADADPSDTSVPLPTFGAGVGLRLDARSASRQPPSERAPLLADDPRHTAQLQLALGPAWKALAPTSASDTLIATTRLGAHRSVSRLVELGTALLGFAERLTDALHELGPPGTLDDDSLHSWRRATALVGGELLPRGPAIWRPQFVRSASASTEARARARDGLWIWSPPPSAAASARALQLTLTWPKPLPPARHAELLAAAVGDLPGHRGPNATVRDTAGNVPPPQPAAGFAGGWTVQVAARGLCATAAEPCDPESAAALAWNVATWLSLALDGGPDPYRAGSD